jgi:hypothetical protein
VLTVESITSIRIKLHRIFDRIENPKSFQTKPKFWPGPGDYGGYSLTQPAARQLRVSLLRYTIKLSINLLRYKVCTAYGQPTQV